MISATIQKAAETISRLDALRKKMAVAAYLKKKRTAQNNQSRIKERQAAELLIERALQPFFVDQIESAAKALAATVAGPDGTKVFCPTGAGGGIDATCGRGGGGKVLRPLEGQDDKEIGKKFKAEFVKFFGEGTPTEDRPYPVTRGQAEAENNGRLVTAERHGDFVEIRFSQEGQFTGVGKDLQKGTLELARKLKEYTKSLVDTGFLIQSKPVGEKRDRVYRKALESLGLQETQTGSNVWGKAETKGMDSDSGDNQIWIDLVDFLPMVETTDAHSKDGTKSTQQTLPIVFNPSDWNQKLVDTLYPAMVKIAVVGMDGEMRRMGLQIKRGFAEVKGTKVFCPTGPGGGVDATCSPGKTAAVPKVELPDKIKDRIKEKGLLNVATFDEQKAYLADHGVKKETVDQMHRLFDRHKWGGDDQAVADKEISDEIHKDTDLGKALRVQIAFETEAMKFADSVREDQADAYERQSKRDMKEAWEYGWGPKNSDAYDSWEHQWNTEEKYIVDKMRKPITFYRKGDADKDVLPTSLNASGAQSHSVTGSAQPKFDPDHNWTADDLFNQGYMVLGGAIYNQMGYSGEAEVTWIKVKASTKSFEFDSTKSTATELLSGLDDSGGLLDVGVLDTPYGPVNMAFLFEYPDWMKQAIVEFLKESFSQPYWEELNKTTLGDIEKYLQQGIRDGWSIEKMAAEMAPQLIETGRYAKIRGRNIARTEAGHALNGARSMGIDSVIAEMQGTGLDIRKLWHSVKGTTTRQDHRDIHGVPADKDGMWTLAGHKCRWPSDTSLPANQRCGCQCTLETSFGMTDEEARELIQAYEGKMAKASWANLRTKVFCPTGAGGGVDATCSPGKAAKIPAVPPLAGAAGVALGPKYKALYDAASTGDTAAVLAVKTNPDAASPYPKKLHEYKMAVLEAMKSDKDIGPAPVVASAPSIDMKKVDAGSPAVSAALKEGDFSKAAEASTDASDNQAIKQAAEQVEKPPKATTEEELNAKAAKGLKSADKKKVQKAVASVEELDTFIPLAPVPPGREKELKAAWDEHMKEYKEQSKEQQKNYSYGKKDNAANGKMSLDEYSALVGREETARLKGAIAEEKLIYVSNLRNAQNPELFEKLAKPVLDEFEKTVKLQIKQVEKIAKAVRPVIYEEYGSKEVASLAISDLTSIKMKGTKNDEEFTRYSSEKKNRYTGIDAELINTLRELSTKKEKLEKDLNGHGAGGIPSAYYGEPEVARTLPPQGMGEATVPSKTKVGEGKPADTFGKFLGQADICIQTRAQAVDKILSSGAMKNAYQGGVKSIGLGKKGYKDTRKEIENEIFGLDESTPVGDRPIYGYLEHPDRTKSTGSGIGGNYGSVQLILKPTIKTRASFTLGDSLDDDMLHDRLAGSVSNPPPVGEVKKSKMKVNVQNAGNTTNDHTVEYPHLPGEQMKLQYVEAQVHGGVAISDIKEVRIERGTQISPKGLANIQKEGIVVREVPPRMRTYIGNTNEKLNYSGIDEDKEFWEKLKK